MRKITCIIISLAFVAAAFSSCSLKKSDADETTTATAQTTAANYEVVDNPQTQPQTQANTQAQPKAAAPATQAAKAPVVTKAAQNPPATTAAPESGVAKGSFVSADAAAVINGKSVAPGAKYASVSSAFGSPSSVTQAPSCHYNGTDNIYTFSGFTVYTYFSGSDEIIYDVEITSSSFSTAKGVKTGDSAERVKEYYGSPSSESEDFMEYVSGAVHLGFYLSSGTVNTIELTVD